MKKLCMAALVLLASGAAYAQSASDVAKASFASCQYTFTDGTDAALAKAYAGKSPADVAAAVCKAAGPRPSAATPRYEMMKSKANPPVVNGVPLKGHFGPAYVDTRPITH